MAVDDRGKRFSMLNFSMADDVLPSPPDGSIDKPDKQHLLGCYSGIPFAPPGDIAPLLSYSRGVARGVGWGIAQGTY